MMKMKALYAGAMTAVVAFALTAAGVTLNTQWQDVPDDTTVGTVLDLKYAVTAPEATNISAGVVARDVAPWAMAGQARPVADLTAATNYTDAATNALANKVAIEIIAATNGMSAAYITDGTNKVHANLEIERAYVRSAWVPSQTITNNAVYFSEPHYFGGVWRCWVNEYVGSAWRHTERVVMYDANGDVETNPEAAELWFFDKTTKTILVTERGWEHVDMVATTSAVVSATSVLDAKVNAASSAATNYTDAAVVAVSNATWTALGGIPGATTNIIDSRAVTWIDAGGRMIVGDYGFGGPVWFSQAAYFYGLNSIEINEDGRTVGLGVRIDESATNAATAVFAASADYALTNLTAATLTLRSGEIGNYAAPTNFTLALDFADNGRSGDCILYAENANPWDSAVSVTPQSLTLVSADLAKALTLGKATTNILTFTRVKANTVLVSKQEVK